MFSHFQQSGDSVESIVQFMLDEQDKLLQAKGAEYRTRSPEGKHPIKAKEEKPSTSSGKTL